MRSLVLYRPNDSLQSFHEFYAEFQFMNFIYLTIYCSSPKRVKFKYKNINFCPRLKEAETIHGTQSSVKHQQKVVIKLFFNYFAGPQSQNNEPHKKWTPLNSACKSFINNFFCAGSCCGENPVIIDVLIASLTTRNPVINSIRLGALQKPLLSKAKRNFIQFASKNTSACNSNDSHAKYGLN